MSADLLPVAVRRWRLWHLDMKFRYAPVVAALPAAGGPVCEIGSGPAGLAAWMQGEVLGVDPGPDERHGEGVRARNLVRLAGTATSIPLEDRSVRAAVAVDTLEHIVCEERQRAVDELKRVTAAGGRLILMGPVGDAAAAADRWLLARLQQRGISHGVTEWVEEHIAYGLPSLDELVRYIGWERVVRVSARGVFNIRLWRVMHLVAMGALPQFGRAHPFVWWPVGVLAHEVNRGPCYRTLVVADLA